MFLARILGALVGLLVCLLASNITQKGMIRLQWNFMERLGGIENKI